MTYAFTLSETKTNNHVAIFLFRLRRHKNRINNFRIVLLSEFKLTRADTAKHTGPIVVYIFLVVCISIFHAAKLGAQSEFYGKYLPQIFVFFFSFNFLFFFFGTVLMLCAMTITSITMHEIFQLSIVYNSCR